MKGESVAGSGGRAHRPCWRIVTVYVWVAFVCHLPHLGDEPHGGAGSLPTALQSQVHGFIRWYCRRRAFISTGSLLAHVFRNADEPLPQLRHALRPGDARPLMCLPGSLLALAGNDPLRRFCCL